MDVTVPGTGQETGLRADWVEHAVVWHVYPLGFVGAEPDAASHAGVSHRLGRIVDWLDYAVELGASALMLGPVFASSTHGYDTVDPFRIDPRLGDEADFDVLIAAARRRGVRVILDGVFNHVGRDFPAFRTVLAAGQGSDQTSWFRPSRPAGAGAEPEYETFEGHSQLIALNHAEPAVADHVERVMSYWLDRGADGWRLDAGYAVPRRFWAAVLPRVRARHPSAWFVGEVIHGDYTAFVRESGVDAVTQYELWKAIWSALNDRNLFELAWALNRHNGFLDAFVPYTFVGNHDVTRLASRLADARHVAHALAILMTVGGTPGIYAGDEQAFRGLKEQRAGGDDAIRPAFPPAPDGLAPDGWETFRLHQDLVGVRRRHPWLHRGRTRVLHLANRTLLLEAAADERRLYVALHLDEAEIRLSLPTGCTLVAGTGVVHADALHIPGHGWAILAPTA